MNPGHILAIFGKRRVDCLLIGGMNFLLRHRPVSTFDVDLWVRDEMANLERVNAALIELGAEWGPTERAWAPVPKNAEWLVRSPVYCLTSPAGAIDIFRSVKGLESYEGCWERSILAHTAEGIPYRGLSDSDMLACQLALPENERRLDRVAYFEKLLRP
jgi:hypothetical protein